MIEVNCLQGTLEWHQARCGVNTASTFSTAVDEIEAETKLKLDGTPYKQRARTDGKVPGDPSPASDQLCDETAIERISGEPYGDTFQTYAMRRGHEMEHWARVRYEELYGVEITESGILLTDDRKFGYSSDGLRAKRDPDGKRGGIEVKTPASLAKVRHIITTGDVSEYIHQCMGGMWIAHLDYIDLVLYVPPLSTIENDIYVQRIVRDDDFIDAMVKKLWAFEVRVQAAEAFWRKQFRRDGLPDGTITTSSHHMVAMQTATSIAAPAANRAPKSKLGALLLG